MPYASEFNLGAGDVSSEAAMTDTLNQFELRSISFTGWQYKSYAGSLPNGTCTGCGNSFYADRKPNMFMQRAFARPFANAVAGEVQQLDIAQQHYTIRYTLAGDGSTTIVVPGLWSTHFNVTVSGSLTVTRRTVAAAELAPGLSSAGHVELTVSKVRSDGNNRILGSIVGVVHITR